MLYSLLFPLFCANVQAGSLGNPAIANSNLLPSVIVQADNIDRVQKNHPTLKMHKLGPSTSKSALITTATIEEALSLVTNLREKGVEAWINQRTQKSTLQIDDLTDPHYEGQWYLESLEMPTLWQSSFGSSDIRVAVVDSGIDIAHPDLRDKYIEPYDAYSDDEDPSPNVGEFCGNWGTGICDEHGTAVSGIAVAARNDYGIVGMCPDCTLVPIKMLGDGIGSLAADIAAFEHAIAADAAVINNSWGYVEPTEAPPAFVNVVLRAQTETRNGLGSVVVFASGNDNRELIDGELCGIPDVICVSAVDSYDRPTAYTNYGADIDVAAPSATVSIAPEESLTTNFGGTSAAAPVVSGLAGWILSVKPEYSQSEVAEIILRHAIQSPLITPDENGHHAKYGFGVINPVGIHAELFPVEEDASEGKGGCSTLASNASSVRFPELFAFWMVLIMWVRRR